jgi:hypothetical protein
MRLISRTLQSGSEHHWTLGRGGGILGLSSWKGQRWPNVALFRGSTVGCNPRRNPAISLMILRRNHSLYFLTGKFQRYERNFPHSHVYEWLQALLYYLCEAFNPL